MMLLNSSLTINTVDVFRRYPNRYESIIGTLCENLEDLNEPEAKGSLIWIIGEYAERIENANELLESFLEDFDEEPLAGVLSLCMFLLSSCTNDDCFRAVQLQVLTATVKLFLKKPHESQELVQQVLHAATEECDNPDLRDRGYVYWR